MKDNFVTPIPASVEAILDSIDENMGDIESTIDDCGGLPASLTIAYNEAERAVEHAVRKLNKFRTMVVKHRGF